MRSALLLAVLLAATAPVAAREPADFLPSPAEMAPLVPAGEVERFPPRDLWEKIDGEAELFRRYGFVTAAARLFADPADADRTVDVTVFTLADPLGAFGLFAVYRGPGREVSPRGSGGFVSDYQGVFWQGTRFVVADAFGPAATRRGDLERSLDAVARRLGETPPPPAPLERVRRATGAGDLAYTPDHLLGREILPPGFEATAPAGVRVFVAAAPVEGDAVLSGYRTVLESGSVFETTRTRFLSGRDPVHGPVTVAVRGEALAGARAPAGDAVAGLLEELLDVVFPEEGSP